MTNGKSNPIFIYITTLEFCNIFVSQIIGWLKLFQKEGINFFIYRVSPIKEIFSKKEKKDTQNIKKEYSRSGKIYFTPERFFLGRILNLILLLLIVIKHLLIGKRVIIQIRATSFWTSLQILKTYFPKKLIIIYDSRAAAAEELIYSTKNKMDEKMSKKIRELAYDEIMMVRIADKVFAVSNALINYHLIKDKSLSREKFLLYPCCAEASLFKFSEKLRCEIRQQLEIVDKKVIVYSGGLRNPWQIPDKVFEIISKIIAIDPTFFFLVLTPDITIALDLAKKHLLENNSISINNVPIDKLGKFLCAADFAILLRDNVPMNNVASPAKFAEYIMTGLPVILSENIGDFSTFVSRHDIGKVISSDYSIESIQLLTQFLVRKVNEYKQRRKVIASLGYQNFSKDVNIEKILSIYYSYIN